jgi:drug/metabolite transporter (DMT)-like permease
MASAVTTVENRSAGILWMLATMFWFIFLDVAVKLALESHPLVQVTWARFFFATVFAALICGRDLPRLVISQSPKMQLVRSMLLLLTTMVFNAGLMQVPLATGTMIMYLTPILVAALSVPLLGEKVGWRRWAGIAVGLIGAMIVIEPWRLGLGNFQYASLYFVLAALSNALYQLATRWVRGDDLLTSLLYTAAIGAVVTSAIVPFFWSQPTLWGWVLLIGSGFAGAVGHYCLIQAFRAAPASVVVPYSYSSILWATGFGLTIWGDWPTTNEWIGAALIAVAGLYIFLRERKLKAENGF